MSGISQDRALGAGADMAAWARNLAAVTPSLCAAIYPLLLRHFHAAMTPAGGSTVMEVAGMEVAGMDVVGAVVFMALAFSVPALGFVFARRDAGVARPTAFQVRARRLAYLTIGVPPLYVLWGVLNGFADKPVSTEGAWAVVWVALSLILSLGAGSAPAAPVSASKTTARLRVVHGIAGATVLVFIAFHLSNHMFALGGQGAHTAVMEAGRKIYRLPVVETVIVALLLGQVAGGLTLAWRWSAVPADVYRVFQIASGVYLACFILCHLNSVLIGARLVWDIPTDWAFMTSAPLGLLRGGAHLVPHYGLGVFFVLGHLASGLRHVLLTHGFNRMMVNRAWGACLAVSLVIASAIMAGLCGVTL